MSEPFSSPPGMDTWELTILGRWATGGELIVDRSGLPTERSRLRLPRTAFVTLTLLAQAARQAIDDDVALAHVTSKQLAKELGRQQIGYGETDAVHHKIYRLRQLLDEQGKRVLGVVGLGRALVVHSDIWGYHFAHPVERTRIRILDDPAASDPPGESSVG